jgi:hypothetical protein
MLTLDEHLKKELECPVFRELYRQEEINNEVAKMVVQLRKIEEINV